MAWTQESAAAAVKEWSRSHGDAVPTHNSWSPKPVGCPDRVTLQHLFGSWAGAMEALGFPRLSRGQYDRTSHMKALQPCPWCGRPFKAAGQQRFCSRRCASSSRLTPGGLYLRRGAPGSPPRWYIVCRGGASYFPLARAIMEVELGRPLLQDEHVHHINGDTTDDRRENLEVLSASAHARLHRAKERAEGCGYLNAPSYTVADRELVARLYAELGTASEVARRTGFPYTFCLRWRTATPTRSPSG